MDSFDIEAYLAGKGLQLKRGPGYERFMSCFFCGETDPKKRKLYVNCDPLAEIPGLYQCKVCEARGALPTILRHFGDYVEPEKEEDHYVKHAILQAAAAYYHDRLTSPDNPLAADVVRWLVSERGFEPDTITDHQLGYADGGLRRHLRSLGFTISQMQLTGLVDSGGTDFFDSQVTIPYHVAGNVVLIRGKTIGGKYLSPHGQSGRLFNSDVTWTSEELFITEGEFDALVLTQLGFNAVGVPGAQLWRDNWTDYLIDTKRVFIVFDNDHAGNPAAEKLRRKLGPKCRLIKLPPAGSDGKKNDPTEWLVKKGHTKEDFLALVKKAEATSGPFVRASTVKTKPLNFLWNNRIPLGKLTIMAGIGGVGKSFCSLALAASITAGVPLLDNAGQTLDGEVLMLSYEDDLEDTLVPRAQRIGCDLDRLFLLRPTVETEDGLRPFGPQDVAEYIERPMLDSGNIRLVVIDPIGSFYPSGMDGNSENQVRGALGHLVEVAAKTRAAVIVVAHHKKGLAGNALHQIAGSQAAGSFARSVLTIGEKGGRTIVAHSKHNLSPGAPSLSYMVEDGHFRWGSVVDLSASDLIDPQAKVRNPLITLPGDVVDPKSLMTYWQSQGIPVEDTPKIFAAGISRFFVQNPWADYTSLVSLADWCVLARRHPRSLKGFLDHLPEAVRDGKVDPKGQDIVVPKEIASAKKK